MIEERDDHPPSSSLPDECLESSLWDLCRGFVWIRANPAGGMFPIVLHGFRRGAYVPMAAGSEGMK